MGEEARQSAYAERHGWHVFKDLGFGPQPIARFYGDHLGPVTKPHLRPMTQGEEKGR